MKKYFNSNEGIEIKVLDGEEVETVEFYNENDVKCYEFRIPIVGKYLYTQTIPYRLNLEDRERSAGFNRRPAIHLSEEYGWINDPNGLIYDDGIYHFYYQYNPFGVRWENMCWGHAISDDLIHWKRLDPVMYPDEFGTMFSGCGLKNERGLLGLPKDALLFFYTVAGNANDWSKGRAFEQRIAYSLDGGITLNKMPLPCIGEMEEGTRDPKIFWHEETDSYVMVLYIYKNEFAIFRSSDLQNWSETDRFSLDKAWECPGLFKLRTDDDTEKWVFWSADGFYYIGEFDGFKFQSDGKRHNAYVKDLPYAAQTYSGVDSVISVPWLRMKNAGRLYTGAFGIPVELSLRKKDDDYVLVQWPVNQLFEEAIEMEMSSVNGNDFAECSENHALMCRGKLDGDISFNANGVSVQYSSATGQIGIDGEAFSVVKDSRDILVILDDRILEVFLDGGESFLTYEIPVEKLPEHKNELMLIKGLDNTNVYVV